MALPRKLKHFNLYNESHNWQGVVLTMSLPKLTRLLEDYRGGGMNGAVGVDLGLDNGALTVEWSIGGHEDLILTQLGAPTVTSTKLRVMGSHQRDDTGDIISHEIVMLGRHEEVDRGDWEEGKDSEIKIKSRLSYYKEIVNGETLIEIDLVNMIEKIGGVDRLEQHRKNLGLSA